MNELFESLWEELNIPLKQFIRKRVPNDHDAEDILQEVFFKIHGNIGDLREDNKIYAWVYRITRNAIIDYYRNQTSMVFTELAEDLPSEPTDDLTPDEEIVSCLKAMITHLPEKYREAIVLTEFNDLSQKGLSEKLGLSLSGAKSRVQRARSMLKEMLLGCCHITFDRLGNIIDHQRNSHCKFC